MTTNTDYDPDRLQTERPSGTPTMTVRPTREPLDREAAAKLVRKYNPDITPAAIQGEVDNIMRESGGKSAVPGDYEHGQATSGGLYQHHNERLTALKDFAVKEKADWTDPDTQVKFSRLEKERDYPSLLKLQQTTDDRGQAEDAFKRIFERPASVMWSNDARGRPLFSDYATNEHDARKNTDVLMMTPQEYLDLSPELNGKPFENPAGRSLMRSFNKGEAIEAVPTMDVKVDGPTATVTDQDGRHRALLARQEGVEAIPVAVRKTGGDDPKEIVGMTGTMMAHDFPKAGAQPRPHPEEQPKEPISLFGQIADAVIPKAEAAERPAWMAADVPVAASPVGERPAWMASDAPMEGGQRQAGSTAPPPPAVPDVDLANPNASELAALRGAAAGLGTSIYSGEELVGKGMQAVGVPGGEWLTNDARSGLAELRKEIAPDQAAHPTATGVGNFLGGMAIPGGAVGRIGNNMLRAMIMGGVGGALTPGGEDFWTDKLIGTGVGAGLAGAGNALMRGVAGWVAPRVLPFYEFVEKVTGKEPSKSPAALAVIKRMEMDATAGGPTAQDMIDLANATPEKALTIADLGGPEVMGLTGRVARAPGPGRAGITTFLNERDVGAGERLASDVDRGIGAGSSYDMANTLKQSRAAAARPTYEAAYSHPPINPDEMKPDGAIGAMLGRPSVRAGMANARKIAAEEGVDMNTLGIDLDAQGEPRFVTVPTWRTLDYVKRGIDNVVEQYRDKTTGRLVLDTYGRAADATRTDYRNTLKSLNPRYAEALNAYSGPSTSLDALHAGEDFLSQRPEEIAHRIASYGDGDREFYKMGAADTLRTKLEKKAASSDEAKALINTQYMRRQLRPLFDSDPAYDRFIASVQAEARMFGTRFNALGGSQTAARRAEDTSPELEAMVHAARGVLHAKAGNPFAAGAHALRAFTAMRSLRDPTTNAEIADILKTPLAGADAAARLHDFKGFMTMLPMTRKAMMGNALADMARGVGPSAGLGLGSLGAGLVPTRTPGQQ